VLAIVPVKGRDGKNRLEGLLDPDERARLVAAMLDDVLTACREARSVRGALVVTPDPEMAPPDADVVRDEGSGHAAAVERALADERVTDGALVLMGDCPLVTGDTLDRLASAAAPLALGPAHDGGLNAVALRESETISPLFGIPDAAKATMERARAAGIAAAIYEDPDLAFDVDTPRDVWRLRLENGGTATHRLLAEILPPTGGLL
jgi:2-phospho-L-lactate guanylyltransferase